MDPDQTVRMRRLVWIHAGCKRITLVLSQRGSNMDFTHYSVGAVPIDPCKNHDYKVEKYCFFSAILKFFIHIPI
jgi:hypothetical protein